MAMITTLPLLKISKKHQISISDNKYRFVTILHLHKDFAPLIRYHMP